MSNINDPKVIIIGDSGVGKTCMMGRIVNGYYEEHSTTIGADYLTKTFDDDSGSVPVNFWDTAGQEQYKSLVVSFYRGADIAIISYSTTDHNTFNSVKERVQNVIDICGNNTKIIIVATKVDSTESDEDLINEGRKYAEAIEAPFFDVSSLNGNNISELTNLIGQFSIEIAKVKKEQNNLNIRNPNKKDGCC